MKTIAIIIAAPAIATVILFVSLRILQWVVTGICHILNAAIDLFREIKDATEAVTSRLSYLGRFTRKASAMLRRHVRAKIRRVLYIAAPVICHLLTLTSWMLSRASRTFYLRYHCDTTPSASPASLASCIVGGSHLPAPRA